MKNNTLPTVNDLEAALGARDDATGALARWCTEHDFADAPNVEVQTLPVHAPPTPPDHVLSHLQVDSVQHVAFRHVRLTCGNRALSEARNWYVPSRLTPQMNARLADGHTPFGAAVADLAFRRQRLMRFSGPADVSCPPQTILTHQAVLRLPDGLALAFVTECYLPALLGSC